MKQIPLSQGKVTLVDDEDFEKLSSITWSAMKDKKAFYAVGCIKNSKGKFDRPRMHRLLLGIINSDIFIDHIDGDGLNNQKINLRIATTSQNNANRKPSGLSKYLGVSFSNQAKKFRADVRKNKKQYYLGCFKNEIDAALAYNNAAIIHHGKFANLNIINRT